MLILRVIAYAIIESFSVFLLIYCISSWFIRDPFNKFMQILSAVVDPVLNPIRKLLRCIPFLSDFPIDFSSLILFLILEFLVTLI